MQQFELDRLTSYDDDSLRQEVRRVAALVPGRTLTEAEFNEHGRVHSSTLRKRFGSWRDTLDSASLGERYDGRTDTKHREDVLAEIRRVAGELGTPHLRHREFIESSGITDRPIRRLFGSWRRALEAAELEQTALGKRYTDEACFENLLAVWSHYGRTPRHSEMSKAPSRVGPKAYTRRWGTWRKALLAFVERVNSEGPSHNVAEAAVVSPDSSPATQAASAQPAEGRGIPLGLRYRVLARDRFRCVLCGRSPANLKITLHIDHFVPWSRGGQTTFENLRTLCEACNLGKGSRVGLE